jgi:hypothetical protein
LPSGIFQPAAVLGHFVDAVEFEVEQFPDPQPASALQPQRGRGQRVVWLPGQYLGEASVDVNGQVAGKWLWEFGIVVAEHQLARWRFGPAPLGDVGQESGQRQHSTGPVRNGDQLTSLRVDRLDQRTQIGLDVLAAFQRADRFQSGIDVGQEHPEVGEPGGDRRHRLGLAGRPLAFQVSDHGLPDRRPHLGQPLGERDRATRPGQLVDDAEVEQHSLGVADCRQVMLVILPGPLLAVAAGLAELRQVCQRQVLQAPTGLDQ